MTQIAAPARRSAAGAAVEVEHVSRRFESVDALRDVSLAVAPGELVAITGRSGSGKSTLLNLIGGLDQPSSGRVTIDGEQIVGAAATVLARRTLIGFVFQAHMLLGELDARMNVEVPMIAAGVASRERRRRALELLDEVGLADRATHRPAMLSGGERQRVAVARALANSPRLLLADEPTGALDSTNSERIVELLGALRARYGMTVIIVSYDDAVRARADRTLVLLDGRLAPGEPTPRGR